MARWNPSDFTGAQIDFIVCRNAAVKEARGLGLRTEGFRDLNRDLKALQPLIGKELRQELREAAG